MGSLIIDQAPRKRTWFLCKNDKIIQICKDVYEAAKIIDPELDRYKVKFYMNKSIRSLGKYCWNKSQKIIEILLILSTATGYSDNGKYLDESILENIKVD